MGEGIFNQQGKIKSTVSLFSLGAAIGILL